MGGGYTAKPPSRRRRTGPFLVVGEATDVAEGPEFLFLVFLLFRVIITITIILGTRGDEDENIVFVIAILILGRGRGDEL